MPSETPYPRRLNSRLTSNPHGHVVATVSFLSVLVEVVNNAAMMMNQAIDHNSTWKGAADRFYCGEFLR